MGGSATLSQKEQGVCVGVEGIAILSPQEHWVGNRIYSMYTEDMAYQVPLEWGMGVVSKLLIFIVSMKLWEEASGTAPL